MTDRQAASAPPLPGPLADLAEAFREGRRVALARTISVVENERPGFELLLHALLADDSGGGSRIGITGPPGAGKSSLVTSLTRRFLERDDAVGIVAVDPTSPYSGGALLGDRIRMNELATDPGVFIRSMASRGSLGGLATTTKEVLDVMDAFGFPRLLVETVGVGQTELEITGAADTVVVVLVPESGDGIQAMKAGLMEIADVFVVNKADRPGADRLVKEIEAAMNLKSGQTLKNVPAHHGVDQRRVAERASGAVRGEESGEREGPGEASPEGEGWRPPVLQTMAQSGEGVAELWDAIEGHGRWLRSSGELERRRRRRTAERIRDVLDRELRRRARRELADGDRLEQALDRILEGSETPYSVSASILEGMGIGAASGLGPGRAGGS